MTKTLSSILTRIAAIALLLLVAAPAFAQGAGGAIKGEVVTTDDKPIEGVIVRIQSPELQGVRQQNTDEGGRFRFPSLPPGGYELTAEKEGFKTVIRRGLVVQLGRTVPLKIVMDLPEMGETVEVIERRPTVDTERTEVGQTFSDDFLGNLPTGRSFQEVIQFLPGVTGGANPNIHGATSQSNQYFVDGVNTTDPVTNTFSMNFNFDAIKDIEVITAGLSVKYGSALGGIVNIVTKSGGNKFEGDFSAYYETSALQSRDRYYSEDVVDFWRASANAGLGGPIIKDKIWFYISYQFERQSSLTLPAFDNGRDLARYPVPPTIWTSHYVLGKITWQANDYHKIVVSGQADPTRIENTISSIYVLPEADQLWDQGGYYVTASWQWTPSPQVYFNTQVYYQNSYINVQPIMWKDCDERDAIGACTDADKQVSPVWSATGYELESGSMGYYSFDSRHNFTAQTDGVFYFDSKIGTHNVAAGLGVFAGWTARDFKYFTGEVIWKQFGDADGDGNPDNDEVNDIDSYQNVQRAVVINEPTEELFGLRGWFYLEDEWQPTEGLTIQPGVRIDRSFQQNNIFENVIDVWGVSPAFQFNWDPFRDGRTLLLGGYRRYVDTGFLAISSFTNRSTFNAEYYSWDDTQHRWDEAGRAQTPDDNIAHFDLTSFNSDEMHIGIQREVQKDLSVEVQYIYRFYRGVWDDDEVNLIWNADGTDVIGTRSGDVDASKYRLRTASDAPETAQPGSHTIVLRNVVGGSNFDSPVHTVSYQDGSRPRIVSVSFVPSLPVFINEVYQVTLYVDNVQPGAKVLLDGKEYAGVVQTSPQILLLSQFDTSGMTSGTHVLQLRNTIKGNIYDSNPYAFSVTQRPAPRISSVTPNSIQQLQLLTLRVMGSNFATGAKIYVGNTVIPTRFVATYQIDAELDPKAFKTGRYEVEVRNPDGQKSNTLPIFVLPELGPTLLHITPNQIHLSADATSAATATLYLYGYNIQAGAGVWMNQKLIGQVSASTGASNVTTVALSMAYFQGVNGEVSLKIKNPDGKDSNETEIWVFGSASPEIYQVLPPTIPLSTSTFNLTVLGRGLSSKSEVRIDGKAYPLVTYQYISTNNYGEQLTVRIQAGDALAWGDRVKIEIRNPDGKTSPVYYVVNYNNTKNTGPAISYISPSSGYIGSSSFWTMTVTGTNFTSASKLFLNNKEVPSTFISSRSLTATLSFSGEKAGEYYYVEVQDQGKSSNLMPLYWQRGPLITNITPPFLERSTNFQTLTIAGNGLVPGSQFKLFGRTFILSSAGQIQIVLSPQDLANIKPGLHTFFVEYAGGVYRGPTVGIEVIDPSTP